MKHLFIFGTRPEAIKMAPIIAEFKKNEQFTVRVCVTGQHREMLDQVLDFFSIQPDYDLSVMSPNQTLFEVTSKILIGLKAVLTEYCPDNIFVQGDTTSAFVGALAGYYEKIKVSHIEAGLRSGDLFSPFPEEGNRVMVGHLSAFHFAPTERAVKNLSNEHITENVFKVGNSGIDALFLGLKIIGGTDQKKFYDFFKQLDFRKKIVLVTGHRRESFGLPFLNICNALRELSHKYPDIQFVYPMHLNPNVRKPVTEILDGVVNVALIEPLSYPYLIWLMNKSIFVLTDSGGIQEEAPSLGKPVLVMRDITERQEGIEAGNAKLVGTNKDIIIEMVTRLVEDEGFYKQMSEVANPYGDGLTSRRVVDIFNRKIS